MLFFFFFFLFPKDKAGIFLSLAIIFGKWLFWHKTQKLLCQEGGNAIWGQRHCWSETSLCACGQKTPRDGERTWWWITSHSQGPAEGGFQSQGPPVSRGLVGREPRTYLILPILEKGVEDTINKRGILQKTRNDCLRNTEASFFSFLL